MDKLKQMFFDWFQQKWKIHESKNFPKKVKQWDIYWVNFGVNIGSEFNFVRPAIVISRTDENQKMNNVLVVPLTTFKPHKKYNSFDIVLDTKEVGKIQEKSIAKIKHLRDVSKKRLSKKITRLEKADRAKIYKQILDLINFDVDGHPQGNDRHPRQGKFFQNEEIRKSCFNDNQKGKNSQKNITGIYAITDRKLSHSGDIFEDIENLCKGGASFVQIREKNISDEEFLEIAKKAKKITEKFPTKLIINDNIQVALEAKADGVHLGQTDANPTEARKILGEKAIIGQSVQTPEMLEKAKTLPLDYIGCGAVFATKTHPTKYRIGLDGLENLITNSPFPVIAIGGIHEENFPQVLAKNPAGIAMVSELVGAEDVEIHTNKFVKLFDLHTQKK